LAVNRSTRAGFAEDLRRAHGCDTDHGEQGRHKLVGAGLELGEQLVDLDTVNVPKVLDQAADQPREACGYVPVERGAAFHLRHTGQAGCREQPAVRIPLVLGDPVGQRRVRAD
jgi:hypothetical protein